MDQFDIGYFNNLDSICLLDHFTFMTINCDQVIDEKSNLINEFTCIMCLNLAHKPLLIECCERLFCFVCAFSLLNENSKCPFCKAYCIKFVLMNKILSRIYNNFRIKCPLNELIYDDFSNEIECKDYINQQNYIEHIFSKCKVFNHIIDNYSKLFDFPSINKNKTNNLIQSLNIDSKLYNHCKNVFDKVLKREDLYNNVEHVKNFIFILKLFKYCNSCETIVSKNSHDCSKLKIDIKCNLVQIELLKLLKSDNSFYKDKNTQIETILHKHPVYYHNSEKKITWSCDFCLKNQIVPRSVCSYKCLECDVDICADCFSLVRLRKPLTQIHQHPLSLRLDGLNWYCDVCHFFYEKRFSYKCATCDFDICLKCYYK